MVRRANDYVKDSLLRLPDFYALRTTTHFEDAPVRAMDWPNFCKAARKKLVLGSGCEAFGGGNLHPSEIGIGVLHVTGETSETVTYRDGAEEVDELSSHALSPLKFLGLVTTGEFGPILTAVLGDAVQGKISWGYWELGARGPLAVFRYLVPGDQSHYELDYPSLTGSEKVQSAYHGEVSIDPANGTVWRITIISDFDAPHRNVTTAIMVEYGPVIIGGLPYMCPLRSLAYSRVPVFTRRERKDIELPATQTRLNEVRFTGYHHFRGDLKILPDEVKNSPPVSAPPQDSAH
jgi:hypothetical protein